MKNVTDEKIQPTRKRDRRENATDCPYLTPYIILLFNTINRESKELLPYSIFIIIRRYKRVKIQRCKRRVVA